MGTADRALVSLSPCQACRLTDRQEGSEMKTVVVNVGNTGQAGSLLRVVLSRFITVNRV